MFGVDTSELLIVAVLALLVIGPKDLPGAMRSVGQWIAKIRTMARHFTSGVESIIREAELEEMEKRWREENERIMREFPTVIDAEPLPADQPMLPLGDTPPPAPQPPAGHAQGGAPAQGGELP